jgi:hypothetical protein
LCTKGLQSDFLAWPRIWSVSGASELAGTSYTENRTHAALITVRQLQDSDTRRPFKLGIKDDLFEQSKISHRRIVAALRSYCT